MSIMNSKLGWCFFFFSFLFFTKSNAQRQTMANPIIEVAEKKFFRYGLGTTALSSYSNTYLYIDFEVGYSYRLNSYFSTSAHLNYGFSIEDGVYFQALQSHSTLTLLFSPTKNNKEYIFKIGGGASVLASHKIYNWDRNDRNGVFPGYCLVMENEIFSRKRNNYLVINLLFGNYSNGDTLIGLAFLRGISVSKIKEDRRRVKALF